MMSFCSGSFKCIQIGLQMKDHSSIKHRVVCGRAKSELFGAKTECSKQEEPA